MRRCCLRRDAGCAVDAHSAKHQRPRCVETVRVISKANAHGECGNEGTGNGEWGTGKCGVILEIVCVNLGGNLRCEGLHGGLSVRMAWGIILHYRG